LHPEAMGFVARTVRKHGPFSNVLEIGSRDVNGSVRSLFTGAKYLGLDVAPGPGVDIVIDAEDYTGGGHDCVVCCEVLEHAPRPEEIIAVAWQALQSDGCFILTAACPPRAPHSGVDGGPVHPGEHYANVREDDLRRWLTVFADVIIESHPCRGDVYAQGVKP
jgi:hypothetical protein